jgi:DNA repair exonuclease SbcCD nuclease subunit
MSLVAVVTDIHIGVRNDSILFAEHQISFFENQLFPDIKAKKIKEIICCGDVFDRRQFSNHRILDMWLHRVFDWLQKEKITFHLILGNHDTALKDTLKVNAPNLFFSKYKNVIIYDAPQEVDVGKNRFLFIPWICKDNIVESLAAINTSKCHTVFGHFEFSNFEMSRGQIAHDGMDTSAFSKFNKVYSGHYHHKSDDGRIFYLGNPFEFTWGDYDDPRGYHIFDTVNLDMVFVRNTSSMFRKFYYDDTDSDGTYHKSFNLSDLAGKYLRVFVEKKINLYEFDLFVASLYEAGLADFKIIEDLSEFEADSISDDAVVLEDSISLVESYVDSLEVKEDKDKIKKLMKSLYVESLSVLE